MKSTSIYRIILILLLIVVFLRPIHYISTHIETYFSRIYAQNYEAYQDAYANSQYAKKKNHVLILDEEFERFAAGFFLKGNNPTHIVHDHPPLGRYFLSGSILIFDNPNTIMLFLWFVTCGFIFLLAQQALKNVILALIPVGIFMNEPLFYSKLYFLPLPEPIQLPFIFASMYFFIKAIQSKKPLYWFLLTSLMIGIVVSTRLFVSGVVLMGVCGSMLVLYKQLRKYIFQFAITLIVIPIVLMLSYTKSIVESGSLLEPFRIQKYILAYHNSKFTKAFSFWDLLFFNRQHTWWGTQEIISDKNWIILWPISAVLVICLGVAGLLRKVKLSLPQSFLLLWLLYYSAVLSTGYTSTRYFYSILPVIYILAISFLVSVYNMKRKSK